MKRLLTLAAVAAGSAWLARYLEEKRAGQASSTAREDITVDVPVRTAYGQWTQTGAWRGAIHSPDSPRVTH